MVEYKEAHAGDKDHEDLLMVEDSKRSAEAEESDHLRRGDTPSNLMRGIFQAD